MYDYKNKISFDFRVNESKKILEKYPDKIPVIIEKSANCEYNIDKNKYLVPKDIKMQQLFFIIRKRIKIKDSEAIFIYVNNKLPLTSSYISDIYDSNKDEDGFLYITYSTENTFG
jgi:GABA(A) receptor-associated protein